MNTQQAGIPLDIRSQPVKRIEGFDLLRGLCAVGVVWYHCLYWNHGPQLHNIGIHFVNIFFVLSGASLYLVYAGRLAGEGDLLRYLGRRIIRLVPLYGLLTLFAFYFYDQAWTRQQMAKTYLNATLLFGLGEPGKWSAVGGGWSIGIEAVFYLAFPICAALARSRFALAVAAAVFVGQLLYFEQLLAEGTLNSNWTAYIHPASFCFYLFIGCWIGRCLRGAPAVPSRSRLPIVIALLILLALASPAIREDAVRGWSGMGLMLAAPVLVWLSAGIAPGPVVGPACRFLGEISYGVYLIHAFVAGKVPAWLLQRTTSPYVIAAYVSVVSVLIAWLLHRFFEMPIRTWWRRHETALLGIDRLERTP